MNVIDTNVWIYRHDSRDLRKQLLASNLITTIRPIAIPWQVGFEFIAASRKFLPIGLDEAMAWAALADMQSMATVILIPTVQLWPESQALQITHTLSFWDALLVAACIQGGVQTLYTEDMGAPRQIDSLSLVNPFLVVQNP